MCLTHLGWEKRKTHLWLTPNAVSCRQLASNWLLYVTTLTRAHANAAIYSTATAHTISAHVLLLLLRLVLYYCYLYNMY